MPWETRCRVSERMKFVSRLKNGERMSDLCKEFGISRKTGYKLKERYERLGPEGLFDGHRAPQKIPHRTAGPIRELLIETRKAHPTWGARKLREVILRSQPEVGLPAASTITEILLRAGLVEKRRRRRRPSSPPTGRVEVNEPNDMWCTDYKGEFRLGNGRYCYPLTITDQVSRYILACEGFERIETDAARAVFEQLFKKYGLPKAMRSDNGAPFASRGLFGLSRLSAWWLKLGIILDRIEPGHPEQNGRHERMHRTLKAETTRPAGVTLLAQQERFDLFVEQFNHERPHEALDQGTPADLYRVAPRTWSSISGELEYPLHDDVRVVSRGGHVRILRQRKSHVFLSAALAGERVGLRELSDGRLLLTFVNLDLGWVDPATLRFASAETP